MAFQPAQVQPQSRFQTQHLTFLNLLNYERQQGGGYFFPHQVEAVLQLNEHFREQPANSVALAVLPTGTGKSGIAVLVPYIEDVRRALVITPSKVISDQIEDHFGREGFLVQRLNLQGNNIGVVVPYQTKFTRTADIIAANERGQFLDLSIANAQQFGANSNVNLDDIPRDAFDLVIVDEAHHYPAETWLNLINHFRNHNRPAKIVFLTATDRRRNNELIVDGIGRVAFRLTRNVAIQQNIIRNLNFDEFGRRDDTEDQMVVDLCARIFHHVRQHDNLDPNVPHQAMIITRTVDEARAVALRFNAEERGVVYNQPQCKGAIPYVANVRNEVLTEFRNYQLRCLVVCGRLLEGFDQRAVSVVGIHRNIQPGSRVLFTQFVGRAVRTMNPGQRDPVEAQVVAHVSFNQRANFDELDRLAEVDPAPDVE